MHVDLMCCGEGETIRIPGSHDHKWWVEQLQFQHRRAIFRVGLAARHCARDRGIGRREHKPRKQVRTEIKASSLEVKVSRFPHVSA